MDLKNLCSCLGILVAASLVRAGQDDAVARLTLRKNRSLAWGLLASFVWIVAAAQASAEPGPSRRVGPASFDFRRLVLPPSDMELLLRSGFRFNERDGSIAPPENDHPLTRPELEMYLRGLRARAGSHGAEGGVLRSGPESGGQPEAGVWAGGMSRPSSGLLRRMDAVIQGAEDRYRGAMGLIARFADPADLEDFVNVMEQQRPRIVHDPLLSFVGGQAYRPYPGVDPHYTVRLRTDYIEFVPAGSPPGTEPIGLKNSGRYYRELLGRGLPVEALDPMARPVRTSSADGELRQEFSDGSARVELGEQPSALILFHEVMHHRRHSLGGGANSQSGEWAAHSAEFRMMSRMEAQDRLSVGGNLMEPFRRWRSDPGRYRRTIFTVSGEKPDIEEQRVRLYAELGMSDEDLVWETEPQVRWAVGMYYGIRQKEVDLDRLRKAGVIGAATYAAARTRVAAEWRVHEAKIRESLSPSRIREGIRQELTRLDVDEAMDAETDRRNLPYLGVAAGG